MITFSLGTHRRPELNDAHAGSRLSVVKEKVMPKFATIGTIEVAPGRRDQLLPLTVAHKMRCLENEPGTVQFEILLPKDDETKVLLYEVYRDAAAFEVHRNGSSFARWREETAGLVVKIYGTRCAVLDGRST
jgi:(4S)-4-hydroxy-5-phosphonooxypentane-2,3-dione isomerase